MAPHRIAAVLLRHYYLIRGSLTRLLPLFIWAAIDIVLWGFITRYLNAVTAAPLNFVPSLLGAVLFWDFFIRVMNGVTLAFLEDVWSRNFLNFFATPLSVGEYVTGLVLSSVFTSALGVVVMLVLATMGFGLSFLSYGLAVLPFVLVLFVFGIAFGIAGCAIVLRLGPAAEWFIWPIPAIAAPFAGVYYPVSTLPRWMQVVSRLLPPSYVFEALRGIVAGRPANAAALAWASALAVGYVMAASFWFVRVYRRAVRTGLIARYSAETVS